MPSHVGIEACIVLLSTTHLVGLELGRRLRVISKHKVVADAFVFLTLIEKV